MNCKQGDVARFVAGATQNYGRYVVCTKEYGRNIVMTVGRAENGLPRVRQFSVVWEVSPMLYDFEGKLTSYCPDEYLRPIPPEVVSEKEVEALYKSQPEVRELVYVDAIVKKG